MNPLIIPLIGIIAGSLMIIFLRYFQYVERRAMIEKGMNPLENQPLKRQRISPDNTLRIGLLLVGAGIGLFLASSLEQAWPGYGDGIHVSLVMIFGGAGLLTSYMIQMRNDKKSAE
jgi:hypothetical protein